MTRNEAATRLLFPLLFQMLPKRMMGSLYSQTKDQDAMRLVFREALSKGDELINTAGNLGSWTGIFPDYQPPIPRADKGHNWILTTVRWSRPTPPVDLSSKRSHPR